MNRLFLLVSLLPLAVSALGQTKVTTATLNFRTTPEISNNIICTIPKGTVLEPLEGIIPYGKWIAIQYKNTVGFVYKAYVTHKAAIGKKKPNSTQNQLRTKSYTPKTLSSTGNVTDSSVATGRNSGL